MTCSAVPSCQNSRSPSVPPPLFPTEGSNHFNREPACLAAARNGKHLPPIVWFETRSLFARSGTRELCPMHADLT